MNREEIISRLKELEESIPPRLQWDWVGTDHYELTNHHSPEPSDDPSEYWWLDVLTVHQATLDEEAKMIYKTIPGMRLGWIIEYAVLNRKLREMDK